MTKGGSCGVMGRLQKKRNQLPCSRKGYDTMIPTNNLPNLIVLEIPTDATHKGFEEKVAVVFSKKSHVFLFGVFFIGLISFWGLGRCVFQGGRKKHQTFPWFPLMEESSPSLFAACVRQEKNQTWQETKKNTL